MAMPRKKRTPKHGGDYFPLVVETFQPADTNGRHGPIHVRPLPGQGFDGWFVQCSRKLCTDYPVGTQFRLQATSTDNHRQGGQYLTSWFGWPFEVLGRPPGDP
jgi:hypothetical protein